MIEIPVVVGRFQFRWLPHWLIFKQWHCRRFNYRAKIGEHYENRKGWQIVVGKFCVSYFVIKP